MNNEATTQAPERTKEVRFQLEIDWKQSLQAAMLMDTTVATIQGSPDNFDAPKHLALLLAGVGIALAKNQVILTSLSPTLDIVMHFNKLAHESMAEAKKAAPAPAPVQ